MKSTDKPSLIETVIASRAKVSYVRTIPKTQTKSGSGEMSLDLGWPPECATPVAAGGKYPQMADANGVLNLLSAAVQQLQARFFGPYNADFATAIGGYPLNAIVSDTTAGKFWVSTSEDNTTVPGADGASWQSLFAGYATNEALNTETTNRTNADTNLQNQINNRVLKSGDSMTGHLWNTDWISAGTNGGWNGARTNTGDYSWTNGIEVGNPASNGAYRASMQVTDVYLDGGANTAGINFTGYDAANKVYQWYLAWNGNIQTPKGLVAFQSDLNGYVSNINPGIQGALAGTSLCVNPSDGRSYLAYSGNTKIDALAWYADVVSEATARANADNNLQSQISAKMDGGFAASGLFDGSQGSTTSGTIVGGTWLRVGNTLTQNLVIENIGGGYVTYPFTFSGNTNQVTVIVQDGTGSNNTFTTGDIQLEKVGIHASGGGGTGRLHLTVSGPYGT